MPVSAGRLTSTAALHILRFTNHYRKLAQQVVEPNPPSSVSGRQVGHYTVLAQIGTGGMAEVFSAVRSDGQFDQKVAMKLVPSAAVSHVVLDHFRNELIGALEEAAAKYRQAVESAGE